MQRARSLTCSMNQELIRLKKVLVLQTLRQALLLLSELIAHLYFLNFHNFAQANLQLPLFGKSMKFMSFV